MSKHSLCTAVQRRGELLVEAQRMVFAAAAPIAPGDSIGRQINRAADQLRLDRWVVWRAWYLRSGSTTHPTIKRAYDDMLVRRGEAPRWKEIKPRHFGEAGVH